MFVVLFVTVPLGMSVLFIVNGVVSESFPFFVEPSDEPKFLNQAYEVAKEHCMNNNNSEIETNQSYEECIKRIEEWFENNPYK